MALSSSLRGLVALTPPALPSARPSGAAAAAPAPRARGRTGRGAVVVALAAALPSDAQWLERLPEKKKPLYTHSLPCIEAWLRSLGFTQSREDPAVWVAEKPLWHARLSLDVTDLHIRYSNANRRLVPSSLAASMSSSLVGGSIHARSLTKMLPRSSLTVIFRCLYLIVVLMILGCVSVSVLPLFSYSLSYKNQQSSNHC